jgi:hypothetical protein
MNILSFALQRKQGIFERVVLVNSDEIDKLEVVAHGLGF